MSSLSLSSSKYAQPPRENFQILSHGGVDAEGKKERKKVLPENGRGGGLEDADIEENGRNSGGDTDADADPPNLHIPLDGNLARVKAGEMLGLPWISRIAFRMFGVRMWGGVLTTLEKWAHITSSVLIFANFSSAFFILYHFVFGYRKEACYALAGMTFIVNMCQVPAERYKFSDKLLIPFLRDNQDRVKSNINGYIVCAFGFVFYFLWTGLPLVCFVKTQLIVPQQLRDAAAGNQMMGNGTSPLPIDSGSKEAYSPDMLLGNFLLYTSPVCCFMMTGWFNAESIYVQYTTQLTQEWVEEYADSVLNILLDDRMHSKARLNKLSMLYNRRGKWIAESLAKHANPFHVFAVPVHLLNLVLAITLLLPDVVGGLDAVEDAFLPYPALRIGLGIVCLIQVAGQLFFYSMTSMAVPNKMFFERSRAQYCQMPRISASLCSASHPARTTYGHGCAAKASFSVFSASLWTLRFPAKLLLQV